ncbi:hypothetical protein C6499_04700 [Candidatus Poribacteria bacterium]|nr:MAG: hypothetical protein C6499_04700 [Candidatus Poribacteria bacterium]
MKNHYIPTTQEEEVIATLRDIRRQLKNTQGINNNPITNDMIKLSMESLNRLEEKFISGELRLHSEKTD